jgi:hypothetical protein
MDYNIQAFVNIPSLVNNNIGITSPVGELSSTSYTYSKEKQYFDLPDLYDAVTLTVYNCSDATSSGNVDSQLPMTEALAKPALYLAQTIYDSYEQDSSISDFVDSSLVGDFAVAVTGTVVVEKGHSLPKYIKFSFVDTNDTYNYQLWFSDTEFQSGANAYLGYEIVVIPPVALMDSKMYAGYTIANAAYVAQQKDRKFLTTEISNKIKGYPPTSVETFELKWTDPDDLTKTIQTEWTMICYGSTAVSPTNLLIAVRAYLESSSAYTVDQWQYYFPDIKTSDFFVVVPFWGQTSKVSSTTLLYSPIIKLKTAVSKVAKFFPALSETEVSNLFEGVPVKYGQLMTAILPGTTNAASRISFAAVYPDYSVLQLNTAQASAYSESTLEIITALEALLIIAEEYNTLTYELPSGTNIVENSGATPYRTIERSVGNFVIKVVTKESYSIVNP